jgi:secondary thiamine-phosphate synthase enzyme
VEQRVEELELRTPGQGLHEISAEVARVVSAASVREGLCTVFVRHTSASLLIQENADPSARRDLERWLARLAPEGDSLYTHTQEGPDDMPSHIRAALTATSLGVPILGGRLALGTWQGIYLWEHRRGAHQRRVVVHVMGQ